jgi:hypothetical protein
MTGTLTAITSAGSSLQGIYPTAASPSGGAVLFLKSTGLFDGELRGWMPRRVMRRTFMHNDLGCLPAAQGFFAKDRNLTARILFEESEAG